MWGQCGGLNPITVESTTTTTIHEKVCKINGFYKVNEIYNPILKDCKVIDIFTKFNFTFYLAIHKETNKQMLLSSGWNKGGCCSCNLNDNDFIKIISQCYFKQFCNDNCNDNNCNNNTNNTKISNELMNEKIVTVECGGYHTHMLTENIYTKEQFIYQCGLNVENILESILVLTKCPQIMKIIKSSDNNRNERIKQICTLTDGVYFVTGM